MLTELPEEKTNEGSILRKTATITTTTTTTTNNSYCSFQDNLTASEYRKDRRVHGLQWPLHPLQIIGWIALLLFGFSTFWVIVPTLAPPLREPLLGVLLVLFVIHFITHLIALLLDPADVELRKLSTRRVVPEFDRKKHSHVIENGRCHLCNIKTTSSRTKHCSVCNKCVGKFDHHCKWLNHCIGGRNYVAFLMCVVSAVCFALVILAAAVAEIVFYHVRPEWLDIWSDVVAVPAASTTKTVASTQLMNGSFVDGVQNSTENLGHDHGLGLHNTILLSFIGFIGVLSAITAGLLLHLCFFHIYISFLGYTTYEYIRNQRANQSVMSNVAPPNHHHLQKHYLQPNGPSTSLAASRKASANHANSTEIYFCSTINPTGTAVHQMGEKVRPQTLHCCEKSREFHQASAHKAFYMCSLLEEHSQTNKTTTLTTTTIGGRHPLKEAAAAAANYEAQTFHCCSEYLHENDAMATGRRSAGSSVVTILEDDDDEVESATEFLHFTEQCTFCSFKIKTKSKTEQVAIEDKRCCVKALAKHHRWRRKWNCCSNVPDSPDVPDNALRTISGQLVTAEQQRHAAQQYPTILNVTETQRIRVNSHYANGANNDNDKHYFSTHSDSDTSTDMVTAYTTPTDMSPKNGRAGGSPPVNAATPKRIRPRLIRPWPVVRLRSMFRMIGRYRRPHCRHGVTSVAIKQNQIRPLPNHSNSAESLTSAVNAQPHGPSVQTILPTSVIRNDTTTHAAITMPALPPPARRKLRNPTDLQELADTLTFVQPPRFPLSNASLRRNRRKNVLRQRSPTLSPIHESGLSNPTSPQPCRHACANAAAQCSPSLTLN
jgi:palmitoyltransferase ZDHHC1/11